MNQMFDDIEIFVAKLRIVPLAQREIIIKQKNNFQISKTLKSQAKWPREFELYIVFQKIKKCLNLLVSNTTFIF